MAWFRKDKKDDSKKKTSKKESKRSNIFEVRSRDSEVKEKPTHFEKPKVDTGSSYQPVSSGAVAVCPPPQEVHVPYHRATDLPGGYGDNMIYLLVRDPWWIYSYWEIHGSVQQDALNKLGGRWEFVRTVLRIYDVSNPNAAFIVNDVTLSGMASTWYVNVQPNRSFYVEIGLLHQDGRFIVLARSNVVTTPRDGMSDVIDEQWMGLDFDKMYALSGGFQVGKSSLELKKLMEERLRGAISSGSGVGLLSSMASPVKIKKRGFWFWLDCELIVYGGTEPDAKVIFQGKEIKLRPDGTFSFRFALPDGKQVLDARAISADGIEEREITPTVTRTTYRPAPVLKPKKKK